MCFSPEASFAVGGMLIPMGGYCLWSAIVKQPRFLGLAVIPLFFGLQQISEGFVWLAMRDKDSTQMQFAALFFLFFALAFWPFWFPAASTLMESQPTRRRILAIISVVSLGWFWVLYWPLLTGSVAFSVNQEHHSIRYTYPDLAIYQYLAPMPLRALYFLTLALPQFVSSETWGRIPGAILLLSALVAVVVFEYAFVSVWCFFAAVMATYCCVVFYRLPRPLDVRSEAAA